MPSLFSRFKKRKDGSKSQVNLTSPSAPSLPPKPPPAAAPSTSPSASPATQSSPAARVPFTSPSVPARIDVVPVPAAFKPRVQPAPGPVAAVADSEPATYDVSPRTAVTVTPASTEPPPALPRIAEPGSSKTSAAGWAADTTLSMRQAVNGSTPNGAGVDRAAGVDQTSQGGSQAPKLPLDQEAEHRRSGESDRLMRESLDVSEIPERRTSLKAVFHAPAGAAHGVEQPTAMHRNAVRDPDLSAESYIQQSMAKLNVTPKAPILPKVSKDLTANPPVSEGITSQRQEQVDGIVSKAREHKQGQPSLSEEGRRVFQQAGLGENLEQGSSVEVRTKWLEPVVQETIIRKERTEYTTILDREIHKYHIYPKIQPIYDPQPAVLPTRHRIFSPADGHWHEVIGDEAAIAILGEDVFYNGPQERREKRELALPALDPAERARAAKELQVEAEALEADGVRHGRVLEREGVRGAEMGEWHQIKDGRYGELTTSGALPLQEKLDWEDDSGVRTMGVAI